MVHYELAAGVAAIVICSYLFGKVLDHATVLRRRREAMEFLKHWRIEARLRQESCRCLDTACTGTICVRFADEIASRWHCSRCGAPCDGTVGDFYGALRRRLGASDSWFRRPEELERVHEAITVLEI